MDLYQEIILEHSKRPLHAGLRDPFNAQVHHVNPTCGDEVTLRVQLDGQGRSAVVADVSYDGQGCSISQASANPILAAIIETITSALYDSRRKTVELSIDLRESAEMHRELYRAIRARKPQEAHNLMEQHLRMAQIAQGMERPTSRKGSPGAAKKKLGRAVHAA